MLIRFLASVMVFRLKKIYPRPRNSVYQPVFLGNAAGPAACQQVFERFGFPDSLKRIAQDGFY